VGELTATALAGVVTDEQALSLVATRGRAMAEASAVTPTGMAAVLGGDPDEVLATLETHGLTPANINGAGQVVAAGTLEQIEALRGAPPAKARVIPLQVAGAFHTHHMAPAVEALAGAAADITPSAPALRLLSNADGATVADGPDTVDRLVRQVSNPVRWDRCMETMLALGVTGLLELAPAGTLVGLAKRAMPGVETLAVKTPDDLEAARALVEAHRS
jgi:[acyl-carrier-protein] S-malonyltransferase